MRPLILVCTVAAIPSILAAEPLIPALGDSVPEKALHFNSEIMTSLAQFRSHYFFDSGAVSWDLGTSEIGRLRFVSTKDSRFHTPENICVGMRYSEVRKRCGTKAYKIDGFAWVVLAPSGWKIAFARGRGMTGKPLLDSAPVSFIYRSNDGA
jgi:hypothetical protein